MEPLPFGLEIPLDVLALLLVAYVCGLIVPFRYALERLRGFGRVVFSKLPYRPPAGMTTEEAMSEAGDRCQESDADSTAE